MKWNAALLINYSVPVPGREAKAMEVFADALTIFGKIAADDKCAAPEVFHHLIGGGMFIVKTETVEIAHEILDMDDVRKVLDTAVFTVSDFDVEIMVTGEQLMRKVRVFPSLSSRWNMSWRCRVASCSALRHGKAASVRGSPSAVTQGKSDALWPSRSSDEVPTMAEKAWLASTMLSLPSTTIRPSARVSSAERTWGGTDCEGSRCRNTLRK